MQQLMIFSCATFDPSIYLSICFTRCSLSRSLSHTRLHSTLSSTHSIVSSLGHTYKLTLTLVEPHLLTHTHSLSLALSRTFFLKDMISHKKISSPSHKVSLTHTHTRTHAHSAPTLSHGLLTFKTRLSLT